MIKINKDAFLNILKGLVEIYNGGVGPNERLTLNQGTGKMVETKTGEIFNTMNLFVCVYDDSDIGIRNQVGVFKGTKYAVDDDGYGNQWSGMVYKDIFLGEVGIYHVDHNERNNTGWQSKFFKKNGSTATCEMTKAVPFEEVRKALGNKNFQTFEKLGEYNPGQATLSEIYKVLELAPEYFGLTQEDPNKIKEKV